MIRVIFGIWLILSVAVAQAQSENTNLPRAYALFDTAGVQIGQPFELTIIVESSSDTEIVEWPDVATSDLQVLLQMTDSDEVTPLLTRTYRAVLWQTGMFITPEWTVVIRASGREQVLRVESAVLNVESVLNVAVDTEMLPWRMPTDLPYTSPWLIVGAIAVFISGFTALIWLLLRTGRKLSRTASSSPAQRAIAQLQDLLNTTLEPAAIYPFTAAITRRYTEERFDLQADDLTTAEFIAQLRTADMKEELLEKLKKLLDQADLVKFARVTPSSTDANRLVRFAIRWIQEAEDEISQTGENGT